MTLGQGEDWISRKLEALEQFLEFIDAQARIAEDGGAAERCGASCRRSPGASSCGDFYQGLVHDVAFRDRISKLPRHLQPACYRFPDIGQRFFIGGSLGVAAFQGGTVN